MLFWFNEEEGNVTYSFIEQKMTLKKKKVPRNALPINSDKLAPSNLKLRFRPDKKDELYTKKDKLMAFDMQIDPGLESEELEKIVDEDYEE